MRRIACLAVVLVAAASCLPVKSPRQSAAAAPPATASAPVRATAFAEPVAFTPIGHPSGACMTEEEIAAEQIIRLHTAMMVTGLTCHGFYRDPALFDHYQTFTDDHGVRLGAAQDTIGAFLSRYRRGNSSRLFDTYQTEVANAESRLVADASAPTYCRLRRQQYFTAATFSEIDLDTYVDLMVDHYRESYRVCR